MYFLKSASFENNLSFLQSPIRYDKFDSISLSMANASTGLTGSFSLAGEQIAILPTRYLVDKRLMTPFFSFVVSILIAHWAGRLNSILLSILVL